jgi:hypothetical protein
MNKEEEIKKDFCPYKCGSGFYPSGLYPPDKIDNYWEYECQNCRKSCEMDPDDILYALLQLYVEEDD